MYRRLHWSYARHRQYPNQAYPNWIQDLDSCRKWICSRPSLARQRGWPKPRTTRSSYGMGRTGLSKTQAVVLELMTRMPNEGKGHVVWLDNLFTSSKLLTTLRDYGIGASGTVRTGRTKREENEERRQPEELRLNEPTQDHDRTNPKLPDSELLDPEIQDPELQQTVHSIQKMQQDMHQIRLQGCTARPKKPAKEKNFGMSEKL